MVSPLIGEVATQEPEGLTDRLRKIPYVTEVTYGETANAVVEAGGFGPPKQRCNRFTVCPLWPLGNASSL